jgi:hypothetical protein
MMRSTSSSKPSSRSTCRRAPRSGDLCHTPRPPAASGHLRSGADAPELTCSPSTSSTHPLATKKTRCDGSGSTRLHPPPTILEGGRAKYFYERLYCARGQAENHVKAWKNHLPADRTSCHAAEANQFRLFLRAGAYWLLWSMRRGLPKRSTWRVMQFDTLRLPLVKIAARVAIRVQLYPHLRCVVCSCIDRARSASLNAGRAPRPSRVRHSGERSCARFLPRCR